MKEKTYVKDIDRSMYDFRKEEKDAYRVNEGLTPEIVEQISKEKKTLPGCSFSLGKMQSFAIPRSRTGPKTCIT